MPSKIWTTFIR